MAVTALLIQIFIVQCICIKVCKPDKGFYSLVLVPRQIVNRNYIYTILHMPEGVHIWHSNWLFIVDYNKGLRSDHRCDLVIEDQSQIYLESI